MFNHILLLLVAVVTITSMTYNNSYINSSESRINSVKEFTYTNPEGKQFLATIKSCDNSEVNCKKFTLKAI